MKIIIAQKVISFFLFLPFIVAMAFGVVALPLVKLLFTGFILPVILPMLLEWGKKNYSGGIVDFVLSLIKMQDKRIEAGEIAPTAARDENIQAIEMVSTQSPGIGTTMAEFIHWVVYANYVAESIPIKLEKWLDKQIVWKPKVETVSGTDLMKTYRDMIDKAAGK